ncbi:TetR/AcrR family transcriptional regulator [Streptacidiphilus sp. EB129]|jgi:AcrR family transcriptional regulator|uniref:TetR/AcrR family transcriptional regulator n=1 Tax=Streptacidiphilus sp. EB129 TaxID=3156262 RepID=UPI003519AFCD
MPTAAADRPRRCRRPRQPSPPTGDERRAAILETAERLLAERRLRDISIDDLARGAGISRPTFYFYFGSKDEVLLTLLEGVVAEADQAVAEAFGSLATSPAERLRSALTGVFVAFRDHRAITLAIAEGYAAGGEIHTRWTQSMTHWVDITAAAVEAERARGAAPDGLPARDLAVMLNAMNERVLMDTYGAFGGGALAIPEERVVDSLLAAWLHLIYRSAPLPAPAP